LSSTQFVVIPLDFCLNAYIDTNLIMLMLKANTANIVITLPLKVFWITLRFTFSESDENNFEERLSK